MNERIKELIEQSGIERRPNITKTGWDFCLLDSDIEKFAELIVKECAGLFPAEYDNVEGKTTIGKIIKNHFGVK